MFERIPDIEIYVTEKMADIKYEVEQSNFVHDVERANAPIPSWVASQMHGLSVWMIKTGQRLHKRYHAPAHMPYLYPECPQTR
jgi:hypothetical protein